MNTKEISPQERLINAQDNLRKAERAVKVAKQHVTGTRNRFLALMKVSNYTPCRATILPDGKVVVVVHEPCESKPNQIFFVTPEGRYTQDGHKLMGDDGEIA